MPVSDERKQRGQFWTPDWLADVLVRYATAEGAATLLEPSVGAGALLLAARREALRRGRLIHTVGTELDPTALYEALEAGLTTDDLAGIDLADFTTWEPPFQVDAVAANPPYIRHQRVPASQKARLRAEAAAQTGLWLDGRTGLHVFFLLRALRWLAPNGRLAFLVASDVCEGIFADGLWAWLTRRYRLEAVLTFAARATPFPDLNINPAVLCLRHAPPADTYTWVEVGTLNPPGLAEWSAGDLGGPGGPGWQAVRRPLAEGLALGLHRPPGLAPTKYVLRDFMGVWSGVVTGANDFFLMTRAEAEARDIPPEFLRPTVARAGDVPGAIVTPADLDRLDRAGRPTLLLTLDGRSRWTLPAAVQAYLEAGEAAGVHKRPLLANRQPWYKAEQRKPPAFLFVYLGTRKNRFLINQAAIVPPSTFMGLYPRATDVAALEKLWRVLSDPRTTANLNRIARSYRGATLRAEPRTLDRLPLDDDLVAEAGLETLERAPTQGRLFNPV